MKNKEDHILNLAFAIFGGVYSLRQNSHLKKSALLKPDRFQNFSHLKGFRVPMKKRCSGFLVSAHAEC